MITAHSRQPKSHADSALPIDRALIVLCDPKYRLLLATMRQRPRTVAAIAAEVDSTMARITPDLDDLEELGLVEHWSDGDHADPCPCRCLTAAVRIRLRGCTLFFEINLPAGGGRLVMKQRLRPTLKPSPAVRNDDGHDDGDDGACRGFRARASRPAA